MQRTSLFVLPALVTALAMVFIGCGLSTTPPNGVSPANDRPTSCAGRDRSSCVAEVATGDAFACSVLGDGTVWCWGRNDQSQLGYVTSDVCVEDVGAGSTQSVACHTFPYQVEGLGHVVHVTAGGAHACAVADDGSVRCWGANQSGQLGNGATLPSMRPVDVQGVSHVTALAAGARHTCALSNGTVSCWGANERLQLGASTSASATCDGPVAPGACILRAVAVPGLTDIVSLRAGDEHTCAMDRAGAIWCWGDDRYGQLGNGSALAIPQAMPQRVVAAGHALSDARALTVGSFHACALRADGSVVCWGRADQGAVGPLASGDAPNGCDGTCQTSAAAVLGLAPAPITPPDGNPETGVVDAGVTTDAGTHGDGGAHADAGRTDAGADDAASEGGAATDAGTTVSDAGNGPRLTADGLFAGAAFTCARITDQTLRCWGTDGTGQLGDGTGTASIQGLTMVIAAPGAAADNPLQGVLDVAAGGASACARLGDYSLRCWGSNRDGALGVGGTDPRSGPVPVSW